MVNKPTSYAIDLYLLLSGLSEDELNIFINGNTKLCQDLIKLLTLEGE